MPQIMVELYWPQEELSPNKRINHFAKNRVFQKARKYAFYASKEALFKAGINRVTAFQDDETGRSVNLTIIVTPPDRRRRDEDNFLARCKAFIDGISAALEVDDSLFHYREQKWLPAHSPGDVYVQIDWCEGKDEAAEVEEA